MLYFFIALCELGMITYNVALVQLSSALRSFYKSMLVGVAVVVFFFCWPLEYLHSSEGTFFGVPVGYSESSSQLSHPLPLPLVDLSGALQGFFFS